MSELTVLFSVERESLCEHGRSGPNHSIMNEARVREVAVWCTPTETSIGSLADVISVGEAVEFVRTNLMNLSSDARAACVDDLIAIVISAEETIG